MYFTMKIMLFNIFFLILKRLEFFYLTAGMENFSFFIYQRYWNMAFVQSYKTPYFFWNRLFLFSCILNNITQVAFRKILHDYNHIHRWVLQKNRKISSLCDLKMLEKFCMSYVLDRRYNYIQENE